LMGLNDWSSIDALTVCGVDRGGVKPHSAFCRLTEYSQDVDSMFAPCCKTLQQYFQALMPKLPTSQAECRGFDSLRPLQ
jgi:hypothetical protein